MAAFIKEAAFRLVKAIDIGYVTTLYFFAALFIAIPLNHWYGGFDPLKEQQKSTVLVFFEIVGIMWLNGLLIYATRNLVTYIPFPLDTWAGFKHMKLKELGSATIFVFFLIMFQPHIQAKAKAFYARLS